MTRLIASDAAAFTKVRADHASEIAQDYVEAVSDIVHRHGQCRVKDLADHLGVSHVTVVRTVARLQEEELVETEPYRPIRLTARGERLAALTRQRHETVLAFLRQLGVSEDHARRDAEGIEHHVSEETLEAMRRFLGENDPAAHGAHGFMAKPTISDEGGSG